MAKFLYSALKNNKQIVKGEIEASSPREAREKIRQLGFLPTKVYVEHVTQGSENEIQYIPEKYEGVRKRIKHLSLNEKILFTNELQVMLSSGIPILEALNIIEVNTPKLKLRQISSELRECIMNGMTFAQALKGMYFHVFGPVYIGLCISGEEAGELEVTLERMLGLLRKEENIKGKIISASIYPCALILLMFGVLVLFSKFIFPAFAGVMTQGGADIPFLASSLIGFCNFVGNFWILILMFMAGGSYALFNFLKTPSIKKKVDNFLLSVPVLSEFIRYVNLSNFMSVLQVSYDAGVPIMQGLELSNKTVGNYVINQKVKSSIEILKQGRSLSEAFNMTGVLPGALLTMIAAGEKSGSLGKMLHDVVQVIDKKIDVVLDALTRLFEPAVILIMGGLVLIVAVAFYQMYFGMLGTLF